MEVEQPEIKNLIKEYEDVFSGIGKLKGVTVKLRVVPNAPCHVPIRNKEENLYPLKEKFNPFVPEPPVTAGADPHPFYPL